MTESRLLTKRRLLRAAALAVAAAPLGGCLGVGGGPVADRSPPPVVAEPVAPTGGPGTLGKGNVKVVVILPLTGPGATAGIALRNAAELALSEFQNPDLTLVVKDDRGSPDEPARPPPRRSPKGRS